MASDNKKKLPYVYVDIDNVEQPPIIARGYNGPWSAPVNPAMQGRQVPQASQEPYGQPPQEPARSAATPLQVDADPDEPESVVPMVIPVFHKVVYPDYYSGNAAVPEPTVSPYGADPYQQPVDPIAQGSYGQRSEMPTDGRYGSYDPYASSQGSRYPDSYGSYGPTGGAYAAQGYSSQAPYPASYGYDDYDGRAATSGVAQPYGQGTGQDPYADPRSASDYGNPWSYQGQSYDAEPSQQLGIQPYRPPFPYGYPQWYVQGGYGTPYPYPVPGGYPPMYSGYPYLDPSAAYLRDPSMDPALGSQGAATQQAYPYGYGSPYGSGYGYAAGYSPEAQGYADATASPYAAQSPYASPTGMQGTSPYGNAAPAANPSYGGGSYAPAQQPGQSYQSPGSGTQSYGEEATDEIGSPLLDRQAIAESPMFDEPPVSINEGMKNLDTGRKKRKRLLIVIIALAVVVAVALAIVMVFLSQGSSTSQETPAIAQSSSSQSSSSSSSSRSSAASSSQATSDQSGTVVYQYSASTTDGVEYTVKETVTFQSNGDCEFATMELTFPDEASATTFVNNLARDYGSNFTLDSQSGANAVVTIDNSGLHLDRDEYENALRYSVDDLVILKK